MRSPSARNGRFFVAAFVPGGGERVYRFRVTREGRVSGFSALPGGVLGRGQWEASTLAATPDGSRVAVAFTFVGSNAPDADYIVGIDTATGARTVWRGTARDLGGASFTVQNLSWTGAAADELVFLGRWCRGATTFTNAICRSGSWAAEARSLDPRGRRSAGQRADAAAPVGPVPLSRAGADQPGRYRAHGCGAPRGGGRLSRGQRYGSGQPVGRGDLRRDRPERGHPLSPPAGAHLADRRRAPLPRFSAPTLRGSTGCSTGASAGRAGYNNGFNGWIHHGRLVQLWPRDGTDADEAW